MKFKTGKYIGQWSFGGVRWFELTIGKEENK